MGVFRKTSSLLTLGAIDFRSDKERTARYARQTRNAVRAQSRMQSQLAAMPGPLQPPAPPAMPARWYPDPSGAPCLRYWDGQRWTKDTAPMPPQ